MLQRIETGELERRLEAATRKAPGVVFGAAWRDGRTVVRCVGHADLRSSRAVARETPFAWFSITKLFTATALMQLVESGRVELDAPIGRYLSAVNVARHGREATVRQLLAHTSGLPNPIPVGWVHLAGEPAASLEQVIASRIGREPRLAAAPGARSAYSNLGYLLLGRIIEEVTGENYEHFLESRVLAPLGCVASGFAVLPGRATAYQRKWSLMGIASRLMLDRRFFRGSVGGYWELEPFTVDGAPYGGLSGPIEDLLRLGRMVLADGEGESRRLLAPESVRAMLAPPLLGGRPAGIGLGWHVGDREGESFAQHIGGGGGYRSQLMVYPRLGYVVAVMANETSFPTDVFAGLVVE